MLLSIVIAAYNAEVTVSETIRSILRQVDDRVEIIVIDDGSSDQTAVFVSAFAPEGVRLYTTVNQGVSQARNEGIERAMGKYIWFIDADDFIADGAVENILSLLEQHDVDVLMANYAVSEKGVLLPISAVRENRLLTQKGEISAALSEMFRTGLFKWAVWKNIYARNFILSNNIRFDKNLFMNEDGNWLFEVLCKANTVLESEKVIYYYNCDSEGSVTKKKPTLASYRCSNYVYSRWYNEIGAYFSDETFIRTFQTRMANGYASSSVSIFSFVREERKEAIALFLQNSSILEKSDSFYGRILKTRKFLGCRIPLFFANAVFRVKRLLE